MTSTTNPFADTTTNITTKKAATPTSVSKPQEAITLLKADHQRVSELFQEFEKARSPEQKKAIVSKICTELTVHAEIEEAIFYPAIQAALKDHELVPQAQVEHASLKNLIDQVQGVEPDGEMFDAKVKVMSEFVKHHVKEEQTQMFPKAKNSGLDMRELGRQMEDRKQELMAERV